MALRPRLSVVIPAFNEEDRLPGTLARIAAFLAAENCWLPAEIVVVEQIAVTENDNTCRKSTGGQSKTDVRADTCRLAGSNGNDRAISVLQAGIRHRRGHASA